eukprot:scaffold20193_cov59-Phaeocystis_antarctica.AAC.4
MLRAGRRTRRGASSGVSEAMERSTRSHSRAAERGFGNVVATQQGRSVYSCPPRPPSHYAHYALHVQRCEQQQHCVDNVELLHNGRGQRGVKEDTCDV